MTFIIVMIQVVFEYFPPIRLFNSIQSTSSEVYMGFWLVSLNLFRSHTNHLFTDLVLRSFIVFIAHFVAFCAIFRFKKFFCSFKMSIYILELSVVILIIILLFDNIIYSKTIFNQRQNAISFIRIV